MSKSDSGVAWIVLVVVCVIGAVWIGSDIQHSGMVEAGAVLVGVVCGLAAGIPTSILTLIVLTQRGRPKEHNHTIERHLHLIVPPSNHYPSAPSQPAIYEDQDGRRYLKAK